MTLGPETSYRVRGGTPLHGTVFVQGAKNAALKMIAASLLTGNGHTVLRNVPPIEDVRRAVELAEAVGAVVEFHEAERTLVVDARNLTSPVLPAETPAGSAARSCSSYFVAPVRRSRHRRRRRVQPGATGTWTSTTADSPGSRRPSSTRARPSSASRARQAAGRAPVPGHAVAHRHREPDHGGVAGLGRTVIDNTAQEPEVLDVIAFPTKMGARITGGGTGFITAIRN